jgi:hypothetical protein
MTLGSAPVVPGYKDDLQEASQLIGGLGRTPQVVRGGLGAGGGQQVPPISWGWRPVQKTGQVGKLLRERVPEWWRFCGLGGMSKHRMGAWGPVDGGAVRPVHPETQHL